MWPLGRVQSNACWLPAYALLWSCVNKALLRNCAARSAHWPLHECYELECTEWLGQLRFGLLARSFHTIAWRLSSVCPSLCKLFAQIASTTTQTARLRPNLHTMISKWACIQGVLTVNVKVKGHVIRALLWWHENRFLSRANGWIAIKRAHVIWCLNLGMSYSVIDGLVLLE